VLSWGASTVGRVAQRIDFEQREFSSSFDTILFGLTVIPVVGWFKLLPTFGGTIVTVRALRFRNGCQQHRWGAVERGHPTGRESLGEPTLQTQSCCE
jgi:hypothetical protein